MLGIGPVSREDVVAVARHDAKVVIADDAWAEVRKSREIIEALADDQEPHYGVSTGFGALATRHIPIELRSQLQRSLVRSHAAGSGPEVEREVVRASCCCGSPPSPRAAPGSARRPCGPTSPCSTPASRPVVYEYGSLGCSGDLAPLAHCALALMGEGIVRDAAGVCDPDCRRASPQPASLRSRSPRRKGLALINGTDGMLGMLLLAITDLRRLLTIADITGRDECRRSARHRRRLRRRSPAPCVRIPARSLRRANLRTIMAGSEIRESHRTAACTRVQDAYSLRCAPQVAGAVRDTVDHAERVALIELTSAIDNPVITLDGRRRVQRQLSWRTARLRAGLPRHRRRRPGEHGSERRTDRFLDRARNGGLNAFLAADPGVDSGYMIAQYTQAAIVSELKRLAAPASVDSIPSSAMQEDHVSMGWSAARKLRRAIDGLTRVLAIELLTAARGIELRLPLQPAPASSARSSRAPHRRQPRHPATDRWLAPEIDVAAEPDRHRRPSSQPPSR